MTLEALTEARKALDGAEAMTRYRRELLHDQIVGAALAGIPRKDISAVVGLTNERIGQILRDAGVPRRSYMVGGTPRPPRRRLGVSVCF